MRATPWPRAANRGRFSFDSRELLVARMERKRNAGTTERHTRWSGISLRSIRATGLTQTHGSLTSEYVSANGAIISVRRKRMGAEIVRTSIGLMLRSSPRPLGEVSVSKHEAAPILRDGCTQERAPPQDEVGAAQANTGSSPLRLLEIRQIRRRLILPGRHQLAVTAKVVVLLADEHMGVALGADVVFPDRTRIRFAVGSLLLGIGPRQRVVDDGDLVPEDVAVALVEVDLLLDDSLAVGVERNAGRVVAARVLEEARLDLERVVFAVAVRVLPLADRIAGECRLRVLGPRPAVGKDPPEHIVIVVDQDPCGLRHDDDLRRRVEAHERRHALVNAERRRPVAGAAGIQVGFDPVPDLLIFGRERGLAAEPYPVIWAAILMANPLTLQVRVFPKIHDLGGRWRCQKRSGERDGAHCGSVSHGNFSLRSADWRREPLHRRFVH